MKIVLTLVLIATSYLGIAQDYYLGKSFKKWSQLFVENKLEKLDKELSSELEKEEPHVFAVYVWHSLHPEERTEEEAQFSQLARQQLAWKREFKNYYDQQRYVQGWKALADNQNFARGGFHHAATMGTFIDQKQAYDYIKTNMKGRQGDMFSFAWDIIGLLDYGYPVYIALQQDLESGFYDSWPAVKNFFAKYPKSIYNGHRDVLRMSLDYINEAPNDPMALRYVGKGYLSNYVFDKAIEYFNSSMQINPFYEANYTDLIYAYAIRRQYAKAREMANVYTQRFGAGDTAVTNRLLAEAYRRAQDHGRAFEAYQRAFAAGEPSTALLKTYLDFCSDIKRKDLNLVALDKLVTYKTADLSYYNRLIDFLNTDQNELKLEILGGLEDQNGWLTAALYDSYLEALSKLEEPQVYEAVALRSIAHYPDRRYAYYTYGQWLSAQGRYSEAVENLQRAASIQPDITATWRSLSFAQIKTGDTVNGLGSALNEALKEHRDLNSVWAAKVHVLGNTETMEIEIWKEALSENQGQEFAIEELRTLYQESEQWSTLHALYSSNEAAVLASGNWRDISSFYVRWGLYIVQKSKGYVISDEEVKSALHYFDLYAQYGGYPYFAAAYKSELYLALGDEEMAGDLMEKALDLNPNFDRYWQLWAETSSDKRYMYYKNWVERNPFDKYRLKAFVKLNTMWNGSYIQALVSGEEYMDRFGNDVQSLMTQAASGLGDNIGFYESRYKGTSSVGGSQIYISWYENTVAKAVKRSNHVRINRKEHSATITSKDGEVMTLKESDACGKTTLLQKGEAFVKFNYDNDCRLTSIETVKGKMVTIIYDPSGRILEMKAPEGHAFYEYNDRGKLSKATIGNEFLTIDYDSMGKMSKVESEGGYATTLKISGMITKLNAYVKIPKEAYKLLQKGQLPDLIAYDETYAELQEGINYDELNYEAAINFSDYLLNNLSASIDYAVELHELSVKTLGQLKSASKKLKTKYTVRIAENFYQGMLRTRKNGVAEDYWSQWVDVLEWIVAERKNERRKSKYYKALMTLEEKIRANPIVLLEQSNWLVKDELQKKQFWSEINPETLVHPELAEGLRLHCVYTNEEQMYIGTSKGVLVKDETWKWLAYDGIRKVMEQDPKPSIIKSSSSINCIEQYAQDQILLGTDDGLLIWNLRNNEVQKIGLFQGLKSTRIKAVNTVGNRTDKPMVVVATSTGVQRVDHERKVHDIPGLEEVICHQVGYWDGRFGLATEKGVYTFDGDTLIRITEQRAENIEFDGEGSLLLFDGVDIYKVVNNGNATVSIDIQPISGNAVTSEQGIIHGLRFITVQDDEEAVAVLTDLGVSIYHHKHFEHLILPTKDGVPSDVRDLAEMDEGKVVISDDRIFVFDKRSVSYQNIYPKAMLSLANGYTLIGTGKSLLINDGPKDPEEFSTASVTYITADGEEDFYAGYYGLGCSHLVAIDDKSFLLNDETGVCFGQVDELGQVTIQELFSTDEDTHPYYRADGVNSMVNITVDKSGGVWAATDQRLYHFYMKDSSWMLDDFCFFDDPIRFPMPTDELVHVTVLPDGRVWVFGSYNGHRKFRNIALDGGLAEFDPELNRFVVLKTNLQPFTGGITGITELSDDLAILNSIGGFQMYDNGEVKNLYKWISEEERNPSYADMYEEDRMLFLGTTGTQLKDMWLFGTPSGVVGYKDEQWFRLNSLNQLLPRDFEFKEYGGRHVTALASDTGGNIFVSTHLGLMVYKFGDQDPSALFIDESQDLERLIAYKQAGSLRQEQQIVKGLPQNSNGAQILKEIQSNEEELQQLKQVYAVVQEADMSAIPMTVNSDSMKKVAQAIDRKNAALFLRLQQQEPALYQMLKIPPLDLMSSRSKLQSDECILQYIAMPNALHIHVLSNQRSHVVTVPVPRDTLLSLATTVYRLIKSNTKVTRGAVVHSNSEQNHSDMLRERLVLLYNWLIRPVEQQIAGYANLMVVPSEQLFYVPFSSLIKENKRNAASYLVEQHNVAMLSTMYLFDLVYLMEEPQGGTIELFGDPDGTLPGAQIEVNAIKAMQSDAEVYLGKKATIGAFEACAEHAGVVHLATHGLLDENDIAKSSLLFNDRKMLLTELYAMKLPMANMVVLSACESGVGKKGLEYSTLAKAFSNAGVPRVLATLWPVDDQASKDLMVHFYTAMTSSPTKLEAFGKAQRAMIADERYADRPYLWSGYYFMGKP